MEGGKLSVSYICRYLGGAGLPSQTIPPSTYASICPQTSMESLNYDSENEVGSLCGLD